MSDTGSDNLKLAYRDLHRAIFSASGDDLDMLNVRDRLNLVRNALDRASSTLNSQPSDIIANSFTVDQIIYTGPSSEIIKVKHRDLPTNFALKTVPAHQRNDPSCCQRIIQEAEIGMKFRHDNLVETSMLLRLSDGRPALLMPWHDQTLAEKVAIKAIHPTEIEQLITDVLTGLTCLHDNGYVHGDIRPRNIFVSSSARHMAKIADFGLTIETGRCRLELGYHKAHDPDLSSPEQIAGSPACFTDDIFSVGRLAAHLCDRVEDAPSNLQAFIKYCCAGDEKKRPQTALQALSLL